MKKGKISEGLKNLLDIFDTEIKSEIIKNSKNLFEPTPEECFCTAEYGTSKEYLELQKQNYHSGVPDLWNHYIMSEKMVKNLDFLNKLNNIVYNIGNYLGARQNSVKLYYPPGGCIGWHHNADAPGRNLLLTWSETGDGFFRYLDKDDNFVDIKDEKGWTVKSGIFTSHETYEDYSWHCAATNCNRITIAYILYDTSLTEDLYEELEMEYVEIAENDREYYHSTISTY